MLNPKYLIVGASGYLGRSLHNILGKENVVATFRTQPIQGAIHFDAYHDQLKTKILNNNKGIQVAYLLFGETKIDVCAEQRTEANNINIIAYKRAIDDLIEAGIKPIFASSDAVYDGSHGDWRETDPTNPILTYGKQKVAIEQYLKDRCENSVIVRLAKLIGQDLNSKNMLYQWVRQTEQRQIIRCANDTNFSPIDVEDAAQSLIQIAEGNNSGIFNVGGIDNISRISLLNSLISELQKAIDIKFNIIECSIRDFNFLEPRPLNLAMNSNKLIKAINFRSKGVREICSRFVGNYVNTFPRK